MDSYDLIVIGTGTAAQVVSSRVRRAGRSVAIIDHRPFGGTCALRGCDPKKMLVSGAEAADWARRMHRRGVVGELRIDWKELIAFKRTFTDPVPKKREESFAKQGAVVQTFATDAAKRSGTLCGLCGENCIPNSWRGFAIDAKLSEFELTFPDPMHEFNAGDGDRGAPKALQSKHWTQTKFDRSMVLLYQII